MDHASFGGERRLVHAFRHRGVGVHRRDDVFRGRFQTLGESHFGDQFTGVLADDVRAEFGGLDQIVEVSTLHCTGDVCDVVIDEVVEQDIEAGSHAYFVRVIQRDFHRAWSSPVYVDYQP